MLTLIRQPLPQLGKDFGTVEQGEVVHAVADPLPVFGERQRARRVLVAAERAVQRHQAVAQHAVFEVATRLARGRGHRVATQALWQRQVLPTVGSARKTVAANPVFID